MNYNKSNSKKNTVTICSPYKCSEQDIINNINHMLWNTL